MLYDGLAVQSHLQTHDTRALGPLAPVRPYLAVSLCRHIQTGSQRLL